MVGIASSKMKIELSFLVKAYESDEASITLKKSFSKGGFLRTLPLFKPLESPNRHLGSPAFGDEGDDDDLPAIA